MSTALPTASSAYGPDRPSAAATVDNATQQGSTYLRENSVQTNGATSVASQIDHPIINARTNYNHPCEVIGDLQYIRQKRGSLDGLKLAFVGEASNLCMSWFEAATRLPISVTQIAPRGYAVDTTLLNQMKQGAQGELAVSHDLLSHIGPDTDVIYTDCWPKAEGAKDIADSFLAYQIDTAVLGKMNADGFFLPCPPVTRGREVSVDAMNSPLCQNYAAKEFLLHSQNAIMEFLMKQG
jgi:ornithine carbamoyltransferase